MSDGLREPRETVVDSWQDLQERLEAAAVTLDEKACALRSYKPEYHRLTGKAEGVRLALSYLREYQR